MFSGQRHLKVVVQFPEAMGTRDATKKCKSYSSNYLILFLLSDLSLHFVTAITISTVTGATSLQCVQSSDRQTRSTAWLPHLECASTGQSSPT